MIFEHCALHSYPGDNGDEYFRDEIFPRVPIGILGLCLCKHSKTKFSFSNFSLPPGQKLQATNLLDQASCHGVVANRMCLDHGSLLANLPNFGNILELPALSFSHLLQRNNTYFLHHPANLVHTLKINTDVEMQENRKLKEDGWYQLKEKAIIQ